MTETKTQEAKPDQEILALIPPILRPVQTPKEDEVLTSSEITTIIHSRISRKDS